jgi:S1-C subfamily serine protease
VVALIGACGIAVATLAGASGGYIGLAVGTEELGGKSSERGAMVQAIAPNSPAMLAGLMAGDVVVAADNTRIKTAEELRRYISSKYPKETVAFVVLRDKGTTRTVSKVNITLTGAPAVASAPAAWASPSPESQGSSADRASVPSEPEFF